MSADNATGVGIKYVHADAMHGETQNDVQMLVAALEMFVGTDPLHSLCRHNGMDAFGRVKGTWSAAAESNARSALKIVRAAAALPIDFKQATDQGGWRAMVDMVPPATSRDRWMYEQGRQAERDPRTHRAELIEELCARIKAADGAAADKDYMLDSDDCISVLRGTWTNPLANDCPAAPTLLGVADGDAVGGKSGGAA